MKRYAFFKKEIQVRDSNSLTRNVLHERLISLSQGIVTWVLVFSVKLYRTVTSRHTKNACNNIRGLGAKKFCFCASLFNVISACLYHQAQEIYIVNLSAPFYRFRWDSHSTLIYIRHLHRIEILKPWPCFGRFQFHNPTFFILLGNILSSNGVLFFAKARFLLYCFEWQAETGNAALALFSLLWHKKIELWVKTTTPKAWERHLLACVLRSKNTAAILGCN